MGWLWRASVPVLISWLLLMPPVRLDGTVDSKAPLSQWQVLMRFDKRANCEASRLQSQGPPDPFVKGDSPKAGEFGLKLRCVANDDPRLKH